MPYKDPEVYRAYQRNYSAVHKVERRKYLDVYQEVNRERLGRISSIYYLSHRSERDAVNVEWARKHPEIVAEYGRRYRSNPSNREKRRAYERKYSKDHPEVARLKNNIRRVRKIGNGGTFSRAEWRDKVELFGDCCAYCGSEEKLVIEHKTPISRGGRNDIFNVVPSCSLCNKRKKTKTAMEFLGIE